jgi:hypothetical protein
VPKRSRIEITAIRRTRTIVVGKSDAAQPGAPFHWDHDSEICELESQGGGDRLDLLDLKNAAPKLAALIEALIKARGDRDRAAKDPGISRNRFHARLRCWGLGIKDLKTRLGKVRTRPDKSE